MKRIPKMLAAGLVASFTGLALPVAAGAQDMAGADATYKDIEATLGAVPEFFKMFPASGIAGAWAEFKGIQLNIKHKQGPGIVIQLKHPFGLRKQQLHPGILQDKGFAFLRKRSFQRQVGRPGL